MKIRSFNELVSVDNSKICPWIVREKVVRKSYGGP